MSLGVSSAGILGIDSCWTGYWANRVVMRLRARPGPGAGRRGRGLGADQSKPRQPKQTQPYTTSAQSSHSNNPIRVSMSDAAQLHPEPRRATGNGVRGARQSSSAGTPSLEASVTVPTAHQSAQSTPLSPLVADVEQSKTCWICLDTDEDARASGLPQDWTHACDCSLIAHEDVSQTLWRRPS